MTKDRGIAGMATGRPRSRYARCLLPVAGFSAVAFTAALWWFARPAWLNARVDEAVLATDWPRAADALDRYLWYRPRDTEAVRGRLKIAESMGDRGAALAALAMVPDDDPESASANFRRGLILKGLYRVREAEAAFLKAVASDPMMPWPRRELVTLYGIKRMADEQVEQLWGLHGAGATIEALRLLGQSDVVIPPGAISKTADEGIVLEKCLKVDPEADDVRPALARFYRMRGDSSRAAALLNGWLESHPEDRVARVEWLACLLDDGDARKVAGWFEPSSKLLSGLPEYHRLRGDWLSLKGRHGEAAVEHQTAVRLRPRDPIARYRLAIVLRLAGRAEDAERAMADHRAILRLAEKSAAVSLESPDPSAMIAAAEACREVGPDREREALAWLAEARKWGTRAPDSEGR